MDEMNIGDAIEVLRKYNEWRLGADVEMMSPRLITKAINKVIEEYDFRRIGS